MIRSVLHIEARHTMAPEQLAADFADSLCRTGALVRPRASGYVVLNPEHARLLDKHGWSKDDVRAAIAEQGWRTYRDLARTGKEAIADGTGWRLPADHPDARPQEPPEDPDTPVQLIASPDAVQIVVAGAPNAGVSSIVETFGPFDRAPATVKSRGENVESNVDGSPVELPRPDEITWRGEHMKVVVGKVSDFENGDRKIIDVNGKSVGVFRIDDEFYAIRNRCPHQFGPLCLGSLASRAVSDRPGEVTMDPGPPLLACPWHGWEYDIATGQSFMGPGRGNMSARRYDVNVLPGTDLVQADQGEMRPDGRVPGPYVVETVPVSVEQDYVVVEA